jgi:flagellin
VITATTSTTRSFMIQGKLGAAVISVASSEDLSSITGKINAAAAQTGVSATKASAGISLWSTDVGSAAFVRTKQIEGTGVTEGSDTGADAELTVNGQKAAVDGNHVTFTGGGISVAFENAMTTAGSTTITVSGDGTNGKSGATFALGTTSESRATLGIDGVYTSLLGNKTDGYLKSLASGGTNSLLNDPSQAAKIAREAGQQIATLQGRIGGFQKFQVQTAISSLNNNKEGLSKVQSVINDVDYAVESAELNRQNVLLQSTMSLLSLANQQSAQVLSLLR